MEPVSAAARGTTGIDGGGGGITGGRVDDPAEVMFGGFVDLPIIDSSGTSFGRISCGSSGGPTQTQGEPGLGAYC